MALFISFEGGEGSGKSTQAQRLVDSLEESGVPAILFHEPGSTNLGFHIRDLIKGRPWGRETISPTAELFLFSASRAELVTKVLSRQAETPGLVIVADRYVDSTTAYQGYGRRMPLDLVQAVNKLATGGLMPHKTFLLDCPRQQRDSSASARPRPGFSMNRPLGSLDDEGSRRFEDEPSAAFTNGSGRDIMELARAEPERWTVIDGMADPGRRSRALDMDRRPADGRVSRDSVRPQSPSPQQQMALLRSRRPP